MNFSDIHGGGGKPVTREDKIFVIVGFLAMLELVKQGTIEAMQEENGSEIIIEKTEIITI